MSFWNCEQWSNLRCNVSVLSPTGWIYDISHSYPLAFFVSGGLCALASCILHFVPVFHETKFSEESESSHEKKSTLERTFCNTYPKLCNQDICHQKIISFSSQVDTPQRDWTHVLAGARETDVWVLVLSQYCTPHLGPVSGNYIY